MYVNKIRTLVDWSEIFEYCPKHHFEMNFGKFHRNFDVENVLSARPTMGQSTCPKNFLRLCRTFDVVWNISFNISEQDWGIWWSIKNILVFVRVLRSRKAPYPYSIVWLLQRSVRQSIVCQGKTGEWSLKGFVSLSSPSVPGWDRLFFWRENLILKIRFVLNDRVVYNRQV